MHEYFSNCYAKEVNVILKNCKKLIVKRIRYEGALIICPNCQTSFKGYNIKVICPICSNNIEIKLKFKRDKLF